jgi:hypothetical protein
MATGRPNKPLEQKLLTGTLRPDRLPKSSIVLTKHPNKPLSPDSLQDAGKVFWDRVWETNWVSQSSDYHLALITAETFDERERVKKALAADPADRRLRVTLRELDKQLISSLSLLGYTPSDRSRLGVAEIKAETKLESLLRKKATKEAERDKVEKLATVP